MERTSGHKVDSIQICALSDGRAGNATQAMALATALAAMLQVQAREAPALDPRAPWRWIAPRRGPASEAAFGPAFKALLDAPPTIAIGCGRQAALATRLLRERGAHVVQVLDPRLDPTLWDLVVAPRHDGLRGANVLSPLGSLHPVNDTWLADARARFPALGELPRPRTAVLLGGTSAHARFDRMAFEVLACRLEAALARDGGSVLLTTSRRSDRELRDAVRHRYVDTPGVTWTTPADGPNPYPGLLAWADRIICSPDSVNMISEACATRVPVHVFEPERVRGRPRAFVDALLGSGRIRAVDARLADFEVEPLRETARIAAEAKSRLGL